jgi:pilus assembly protein CpaF
MFSILVNEKGGESKRLEFDKPEVTIGRVQGNDIILPKGNVSKRHSRIVLKDGKFIIVDLKSTNGTYVNGRKITSPLVVKNTDKIYIGDFILAIEEAGGAAAAPEPAEPAAPAPRPRTMSSGNVPPPPPRRLAEEEDGGAAAEADGDSTLGAGAAAAEEAPPPEPPRRPAPAPEPPPRAAPIPTMRPQPVSVPRPAEPARSSRSDVPAIAPSRPTQAPPRPAPVASAPPPAAAPRPAPQPAARPAPAPAPRPRPPAPSLVDGDAGRRNRIADAMRTLSNRVATALGNELHRLAGDALRERAEAAANEAVGEIAQESGLPPGVEPDQLLRDVVAETIGLGPLEELMQDESVFAITVARPDRIYVDRVGQGRSLAARGISSADAVHRMLHRIASRTGRVADLQEALARGGVFEARLDGGFALTAVVGGLSASGASVVVRRGRRDVQRLADLAQAGVLSAGMADFLELAVRARRNIVVAGAAGSGRSTLIGALARAAEGQRVVLVEETAELDAGDQPWISITGAGGEARRAFAAALRMKPERLVMGDVRGSEALDVVATMAGGLDGAIIGVTAGSSRDALARLAGAARMSVDAPSASTIDAELGAGVHVVVTLGRAGEGEVRVAEIAEVTLTAEGPAVTPVFSLRGEGAGARFQASGHVPGWAEGAPASMFRA